MTAFSSKKCVYYITLNFNIDFVKKQAIFRNILLKKENKKSSIKLDIAIAAGYLKAMAI